MLRPSRKIALALEAVVDIAVHGATGPVQSQDIADRLELPRRYLEQVMQQLVRAGVLKGVRGPRGGYRLAREQRRIAVGEVLRIAARQDEAIAGREGRVSRLAALVLDPFWGEVSSEVADRMDSVTIEDLANRARGAGIDSSPGKAPDFAI